MRRAMRTATTWVLAAGCAVAATGSTSDAAAQSKSAPRAVIVLGARDSAVTPQLFGYSATGGGTVAVTQPAPDTFVVTMTGAAGAGACACGLSHASLDFVLHQGFEIEFAPNGPQSGELEIEARVIGQLRSEGKKGGGTAGMGRAGAVVGCDVEPLVTVALDPQRSACGEGLAVNAARGPVRVPIVAGCFNLHQEFGISATQPKCLLPRKASVDFSPPSALEAKWIGDPDPFHGVNRGANGFQVTIRVIPDPEPAKLPSAPAPTKP